MMADPCSTDVHPELLARDLKAMFGKRGGSYGVVKGKDGYVQAGRARL